MERKTFLPGLMALLGLGLSASPARPYSPGKHHSAKRKPAKVAAGSAGCKAARKGIAGVPRGYNNAIGVNGINGSSGGGREPGGACVTLCKKKQRVANFQKGWQR